MVIKHGEETNILVLVSKYNLLFLSSIVATNKIKQISSQTIVCDSGDCQDAPKKEPKDKEELKDAPNEVPTHYILLLNRLLPPSFLCFFQRKSGLRDLSTLCIFSN